MGRPISSAASSFATALALAVAVMLGATGRAAGGADGDDTAVRRAARARLADGVELMRKGDPAGALARFEEAYALVPSPKIQYDLALAHQALGHRVQALGAYQRFVAESSNANPDSVAKARKEIAALETALARVRVLAPEGARLTADGAPAGTAPLPGPLYFEPGEHEVAAVAAGRTVARRLTAVAGAALDLTLVEVPPSPAGAPAAPAGGAGVATATAGSDLTPARPANDAGGAETRPVYRRAWFWGVVGGAAVAAGLAAVLLSRPSASYPSATMGTYPAN